MASDETPGQALKRIRKEHGYTRKDVALLMGVTDKAVGHWETDHVQPTPLAKKMLASFMGVPPSVWETADEPMAAGGAK